MKHEKRSRVIGGVTVAHVFGQVAHAVEALDALDGETGATVETQAIARRDVAVTSARADFVGLRAAHDLVVIPLLDVQQHATRIPEGNL